MSYTKNTWGTGDVITAAKLNNIENGIEEISGNGGGGNNDFIVTVTNENEETVSDKTIAEIYAAFQANKNIRAQCDVAEGETIIGALTYCSEDSVSFCTQSGNYIVSIAGYFDKDENDEIVETWEVDEIDLSSLVEEVTVTGNATFSVSSEFVLKLIPEAWDEGRAVFLRVNDNRYLPLVYYNAKKDVSYLYKFAAVYNNGTGWVVEQVEFNNSRTGTYTVKYLPEDYVVTFTENNGTVAADKTIAEIYAAKAAGKRVYGIASSVGDITIEFPLTAYGETHVQFGTVISGAGDDGYEVTPTTVVGNAITINGVTTDTWISV